MDLPEPDDRSELSVPALDASLPAATERWDGKFGAIVRLR